MNEGVSASLLSCGHHVAPRLPIPVAERHGVEGATTAAEAGDADLHVSAKLVVYLDIDGTLLYDPGDGTGREDLDYQFVCEGLTELLEFVVVHCEPYWLSYRARLGRTYALEQRLIPHLPELARQIPPAYWDHHKHEALDPSRPFLWFDDDPEDEDLTWLQQNNRRDALVRMDAYAPTNPIIILQTLKRTSLSRSDMVSNPLAGEGG